MSREPCCARPLVKLELGRAPEIYLKLENLQPTNAYKIRGAYQCGRQADG
jgi:threonine dehydratase